MFFDNTFVFIKVRNDDYYRRNTAILKLVVTYAVENLTIRRKMKTVDRGYKNYYN